MVKMLISASPMFVDVLDQGTILQVVLQLEIENTAKGNYASEDLHETGAKFFSASSTYLTFSVPNFTTQKEKHHIENDKLFSVFLPSVPPPPPNC